MYYRILNKILLKDGNYKNIIEDDSYTFSPSQITVLDVTNGIQNKKEKRIYKNIQSKLNRNSISSYYFY